MSTDAPRLAVIAESDATGSLVREVLATTLPGIETRTLDPAATTLALERTDCVLIDAMVGGEPGLAVLRRIRAAGYDGAVVMFVAGRDCDASSPEVSDAASLGARCIPHDGIAASLGPAVADAVAASGDEPGAAEVRAAMRRTQRLVAAGEIALRMQHSLNNPLAALLAEVQMLAMEPLDAEHQEAVDRIVDLCRRVIGIVRRLDGVGDRKGDEPKG
jgi:signal transduction histidine kinase